MIEGFETARLRLRPLTLDDLDLLVALDADPEVMRYINGGVPSSRNEVTAVVRQTREHRWVARESDGGDFVGWFALRPSGERRHPDRELGYRLRQASWGRGYATEGGEALVEYAFTRLDARRVWAQTMTVNERSRRVLERCGLRYVRTFHLDWETPIDGTEDGDVEYELHRDDWRLRREAAAGAK